MNECNCDQALELKKENAELMEMVQARTRISDNWMKRYGEALQEIKKLKKGRL